MNKRILGTSLVFVVAIVTLSYAMKKTCSPNEVIQIKLQSMVDRDQEMRAKLPANFNPEINKQDAQLKEDIREIDRANTAALKEILSKVNHNWITISEFGSSADKNAWLLVQHADQDPKFQEEILSRLELLCESKETDCANVAYLADRVAVAQKRPQKYGTQFKVQNGQLIFNDIEDQANVDARRLSKGMPTLKEYETMAREAYKLPPLN